MAAHLKTLHTKELVDGSGSVNSVGMSSKNTIMLMPHLRAFYYQDRMIMCNSECDQKPAFCTQCKWGEQIIDIISHDLFVIVPELESELEPSIREYFNKWIRAIQDCESSKTPSVGCLHLCKP